MKSVLILITAVVLLMSCSRQPDNPFSREFDTPFGTPPFDRIREAHFLPAFQAGIEDEKREIEAIATHPETPTFANTLEALDRTGESLSRVRDVFFNLYSAMTNDRMDEIAKQVSPMLSKHRDDILLDERLFRRVKAVYEEREKLNLQPEQAMLLEKQYKDFVRGGANLDPAGKETLRKINEELSLLSLKFGENVLKEDNAFELVIEDSADLDGLPEGAVAAAAEAASERNKPGKWIFTLHKPSLIPFLQYSKRRDMREKMFKAYIMRGDNGNAQDNKAVASRIASLRAQKAALLGYPTYAHFALEESMAAEPGQVYSLLRRLWKPALKRAAQEAASLQALIDREGSSFKLQPWDWWYYAEKLKKAEYDLDEEMLRPYFKLENVIKGVFTVAQKLYGLSFKELRNLPVYHPDVQAFEVTDADGSHVGILYTDYFPRPSKRGGAWMSNYRDQYRKDGKNIRPIIVNVGNFTKPTSEKPSLLTLEEVETLFHEFGHALHGLLANTTYRRMSGTSVPRDFVELPSQIMENWAKEPEVLKMYARHFETDEPMPDALIDKIRKSSLFNQGFATTEYLAASFLDMDWHVLTDTTQQDANTFEKKSLDAIGLIPEIVTRYRTPHFRHVFGGGYAAGYYSYIWAEVLDADAFEAFREKGLFDPETAGAFRKHILSAGGSEDAMTLYRRFRGAEPKIDPLLKKRGLI
ncbi:M3 family metallopeptidase [bacterium]|nr:M3 family metallopeptidase [bacterium]